MSKQTNSDLIRREDALRALDESYEVTGPAYRQIEIAISLIPAVCTEEDLREAEHAKDCMWK